MNKSKLTLLILGIGLPPFMYGMTYNKQLVEAITRNDYQEVKEILSIDTDIHAKDDFNNTYLHLVTCIGKAKMAKLLLDAGANIDTQDNSRQTPLHIAAHFSNTDLVKLLLEYGADQTLKDLANETALDIAKANVRSNSKEKQEEMIQLLSQTPSLKILSIRAIRKFIRQKQLTLGKVKSTIPQDMHNLFNEASV